MHSNKTQCNLSQEEQFSGSEINSNKYKNFNGVLFKNFMLTKT